MLITLVKLVDCIPHPPQPAKLGRGRPKVYSDRLFLKSLVIMLIKHLSKVSELEQPTAAMRTLQRLLTTQDGRHPSRRTFERRLKAMPETLPAQIAWGENSSKASNRGLTADGQRRWTARC